MDSVFKREFNLRASDFDCFSRITPTAILDLFQEVAGNHAEELGIGFDALIARKCMWVIVKTKFEVIAQPMTHTAVTVKTWPLPPSRIGFQREYLIEDKNGNTLIKGTSDWVVMHSEERRLMPAGDVYPVGYEFCTDKSFEERTARIRDFEAEGQAYTVTASFSDLDMNGHVNNIKYANFVLNAADIKEEEIIESFQVDYHREVQKGATLTIHTKREGKELIAKGTDENGERMFCCKITFK